MPVFTFRAGRLTEEHTPVTPDGTNRKNTKALHMQPGETDTAFHRKLLKEMAVWEAEGLLTPDQKERILARYRQIEEIEQKAGPGKLVTTISILGAVLIGLGVLLLIASNWSEIPRWGKLGIIFGAMLTGYGTGYVMRYEKRNYPRVGASLILLGSIVFGAGIFLVAQIYNVTVHYPNGPLLWGLGILPLAYLLRFKSILTLSLIAFYLWLGMEMSFHISQGAQGLQIILVYFMAGIMIWSVGLAHQSLESFRNLSAPYILAGVAVTFMTAFGLTFDLHREKLWSMELMPFYAAVMILFAAAALLYAATGRKDTGWKTELTVLSALMGGILLLSILFPDMRADTGGAWGRMVFNLLFAAGIIGLICLGYVRRYPPYINFGLLFFVLDVTARYFDFFWKLLPRSIFFIVGGLILLAGGMFLERKRRAVIESFSMREDAA